MDPQYTVLLASISCGLASVCVVLSLWSFARLSSLEAKTGTMETALPHKRVVEMEQAWEALNSAYDAQLQKNSEWKQAVHNSVQRMDNIMRRNEQAKEQLLDGDGNIRDQGPDVVKGELPHPDAPEPTRVNDKQERLRQRYMKNRNLV